MTYKRHAENVCLFFLFLKMLIFDRLKSVKAFVFRAEGVLTNGVRSVNREGSHWIQYYIRDKYALRQATSQGYPVLVLQEHGGPDIAALIETTGIEIQFTESQTSASILDVWLKDHQLTTESALFMGSDLPDLSCMRIAATPTCPADAVEEIKQAACYISPKGGGAGAIRDIIEKTLKLQGTWNTDLY